MVPWRLRDGASQLITAIVFGASATGAIFITIERFEHYRAEAAEPRSYRKLSPVQRGLPGNVLSLALIETENVEDWDTVPPAWVEGDSTKNIRREGTEVVLQPKSVQQRIRVKLLLLKVEVPLGKNGYRVG